MSVALKKGDRQTYYNALVKIMSENNKNNNFYEYKKKVIACMIDMGATDNDCSLLTDEMILNGINNNWEPESVAWAILQ